MHEGNKFISQNDHKEVKIDPSESKHGQSQIQNNYIYNPNKYWSKHKHHFNK